MIVKPTRIRLSRAKGFNLQETSRKYNGLDCVKVDRTNRLWGNPFVVGKDGDIEQCLELYRAYLIAAELDHPEKFATERQKIIGKNLACWCNFDKPCHVDVLLNFLEAE